MNTVATHNASLSTTEAHGVVSREDVAIILAELADDPTSFKQVFAVIDSDLKPNWGQ